ncbi:hypothetical protein I7I53_12032 [Histoplasma capsulatum var. duboisii H88]|uniref:Uncharacterized protein n=1 Tax=Ajellomyces capsulatus (strain H88) TaxID=544711 RepID=A0A8A1LVF3_AJEC8|nr:hypothetical protein I7I53_12032 [Histoplasma capsulatum var. duboisii H88]
MGCCIPVYRCRRRWTREERGGGSGYLLRQRFGLISHISHCPVQVNPLEPITARKALHEAEREVESIFPVFDLEMRNEYGIEG